MKRFLCLVLGLMMLLSCACAGELNLSYDLTVAEKLYMQVSDGSGFSGTMQLETRSLADDSVLMSIPFEWDYIHVLAHGLVEEEHRASLILKDGDNVAATTYLQYKDQLLRFQSSLCGDSWYELSAAPAVVSGVNAEVGQLEGGLAQSGDALAQSLGLPAGMLRFLPVVMSSFAPADDNMPLLLDRYLTKVDIWLEGHRTKADIGKLDDGTGIIQFSYSISPSNVKAQLKQMIVDLLGDAAVVDKLTQFYGEEIAAVYLNPSWQPYYLGAVDELPLQENLTIDRTVAFTGDTLNLSLSLPYHDPVMGDCVLTYYRELGEDQQPLNQIAIETENRTVSLEYMEYSSLTDVSVMQGTLSSLPAENAENAAAPLAVAFVLRVEETNSKNDEGYLVQNLNYQLNLAPDQESGIENLQDFEPLTIELAAEFSSKPPDKAATQITASLAFYGEDAETKTVLNFQGKTRVKWTPAELPKEIVNLDDMPEADRTALMQTAVSNLLPLIMPQLKDVDLEASSIGIIGGADGPTSMIVAEPETQNP